MKFLKSILVSLLVLAVSAGCCSTIRHVPPPIVDDNSSNISIAKHIQDATVALVMGPPGEKAPYCAGVWVDEKHILTAAHCAEVLGRSVMETSEDEEYNPLGDLVIFINHDDLQDGEIPKDQLWVGLVKSIDRQRDLALIQSINQSTPHTIVKLASGEISVAETTHVVGHPVGFLWTYTKGVVSAIRNMQGPALAEEPTISKIVQISAPIWVGNSGGGAFDSKGNLIGLCSWITLKAPNIGFFIHRDEIEKFLKVNSVLK